MKSPSWKQVKRELKRDESGEFVVDRITEEIDKKEYVSSQKKELIDFTIKILTPITIFLPLFLFFLQFRNAEINKRNEELTQTFIDVAFDTEKLLNADYFSKDFQSANDNLLYKYPAKIAAFKIISLDQSYNELLKVCKLYKNVKEISQLNDTLKLVIQPIFNSYKLKTEGDPIEKFSIEFYGDLSNAEIIRVINDYKRTFEAVLSKTKSYASLIRNSDSLMYKTDSTVRFLKAEYDSMSLVSNDLFDMLTGIKLYLTKKKDNSYDYYSDPYNYYVVDLGELIVKEVSITGSFNKHSERLFNLSKTFEIRVNQHRDEFKNVILNKIKG